MVVVAVGALSGCISYQIEQAYAFTEPEVVRPSPELQSCDTHEGYVGSVPSYTATYSPQTNLHAIIQLDNEQNLTYLPRRVLGDTEFQTLDPDELGDIEVLKVAVTPRARSNGFHFDPTQSHLLTDGRRLSAANVTKRSLHNFGLRTQEHYSDTDVLMSLSSDYQVYVLEFDLSGVAQDDLQLVIAGFDFGNEPVDAQVFDLSAGAFTHVTTRYDWNNHCLSKNEG